MDNLRSIQMMNLEMLAYASIAAGRPNKRSNARKDRIFFAYHQYAGDRALVELCAVWRKCI